MTLTLQSNVNKWAQRSMREKWPISAAILVNNHEFLDIGKWKNSSQLKRKQEYSHMYICPWQKPSRYLIWRYTYTYIETDICMPEKSLNKQAYSWKFAFFLTWKLESNEEPIWDSVHTSVRGHHFSLEFS